MSISSERHMAEVRRCADQLEDPAYRPDRRTRSEIVRAMLHWVSATRRHIEKRAPTDHDFEEVRHLTRMVGAIVRRHGA